MYDKEKAFTLSIYKCTVSPVLLHGSEKNLPVVLNGVRRNSIIVSVKKMKGQGIV